MAGQGGLDPEVRIEDASGAGLGNEDFGDGKVSRLTFSPGQPGTFRVIASTFKAGITGDFSLTASVLDLKPAAVREKSPVMPALKVLAMTRKVPGWPGLK